MSSPSAPTESRLRAIQQLLPTCQRCRRLRRKCDTQLPGCRLCQTAGAECTFYDHALKQVLPRAYVQSLLTRIEHLEAVKNGISNSPSQPARAPFTPRLIQDTRAKDPAVRNEPPNFDVVIPSTSSSGRSRYWGSSSVFALTFEILQHAVTKGFVSVDESDSSQHDVAEEDYVAEYSSYSQIQAPDSDIQALVRLYLVSLNTMYGFVDQAQTATDLEAYQALRQQPNFSPDALHGDQAHRYFRITMMCAISCANQARYRPYRAAECFAYYAGAVACVEEVTSEASPASLQALLLLIVFYLFHPRRGDIWKLLDYACRLTIELGYHTEAEHDQTTIGTARGEPEPEPAEAQRKLRRSSFWGLYAIERIVGQLFGRGSDLPETMITTEYPSSLDTAAIPSPGGGDRPRSSGTDMSSVDQATLQSMSIAHHYRLVYLRSEIFRTLYLPASPPELGLEWLKDRYMTLHAWRRELEVSDELTGVATVTCDVGYDATICFLFQPMLLKALRATATAPPASLPPAPDTRNAARASDADADEILVGSDPFYSAVNLIRTYEKIIRAPERSVLGTYPMTFMSAHYIYLASSTVLAYALLRLEGRVKVLKQIRDGDGDRAASTPAAAAAEAEHDTEEIDWGVFVDVSISCLILLSWCGERWPGMIGMLETYQELFRKTAKDLIRNGIVR